MRLRALGQGACVPESFLLMSTSVTLVKSFSLWFFKMIYFVINYVYTCVCVWIQVHMYRYLWTLAVSDSLGAGVLSGCEHFRVWPRQVHTFQGRGVWITNVRQRKQTQTESG